MKKILIIEDMKDAVKKIKERFQNEREFKVVGPDSVDSKDQALLLMEEHKPNIIGLDMSLTNNNKEGIEIARFLQDLPYQGLVIVISNYQVDVLIEWVGGYGIKHYAGGKDQNKFYECVTGKCQCQYWSEFLAMEKVCLKRNRNLNMKKVKEKIVISMEKKHLAIATAKRLLKKAEGKDNFMIEFADPGYVKYAVFSENSLKDSGMDKLKIRVISDFVADNVALTRVTTKQQINEL